MHYMLTAVLMVIGLYGTAAAQDREAAARGAQVYAEQKCSACHSVAGQGNQRGPLDDVGSRLSAEELRQWLINPRVMTEKTNATRKPLMPAYTTLPKEDIEALVVYMQTLEKKE